MAQRVADLLRSGTPTRRPTGEVVELVYRNLQIRPPASQQRSALDGLKFINLEDPLTYSHFFATTLCPAIRPNFPSRPSATLLNCIPKRGA